MRRRRRHEAAALVGMKTMGLVKYALEATAATMSWNGCCGSVMISVERTGGHEDASTLRLAIVGLPEIELCTADGREGVWY